MARESYHMLFQRYAADYGTYWAFEFGDFDRETVEFELDDYRGHDVRKADLRILSCKTIGGKAPPQAFIDGMLAKLNAE